MPLLFPRATCAGYFIERWLKPMMTKKVDEKKVRSAEVAVA